jgi:hypothetical protein
MLKRILSVLLTLTFLIVLPALSGCEKEEGDNISVQKTKKVENVPVGDPKIIQKGDN